MGQCVIRASQDVARYGVYSTIVDNFVWVDGDRDETVEYLLDSFRPGSDRYVAERERAITRLDKADEFGSDSWSQRAFWHDRGVLIMNNEEHGGDGVLLRSNIAEFMRRIAADENTADLLIPFEDD